MGHPNFGNNEQGKASSDHRTFQHYAKLDAEGHVIAIVELADDAIDMSAKDQYTDSAGHVYVNVTTFGPHHDLHGVQVSPQHVKARDFTKARAELKAANRVAP